MQIGDGDLVMVHSSLLTLGKIADHSLKQIPQIIAGALLDIIGPNGTLVVPALNFGFCRGDGFDRQQTPSENMGILSEYIRQLPNACRSRHPMQSVAAVGPLAETICEPDTPSAFDQGSSFDLMIDRNARLLLLGASFQAATVIHHAEQSIGVPYRLWKDFTGRYVDQTGNEPIDQTKTYRMYVRDLEIDAKLNMKPLELELAKRHQLLRQPLGGGVVRSCQFVDLIETARHCLKADPNCLVGN